MIRNQIDAATFVVFGAAAGAFLRSFVEAGLPIAVVAMVVLIGLFAWRSAVHVRLVALEAAMAAELDMLLRRGSVGGFGEVPPGRSAGEAPE